MEGKPDGRQTRSDRRFLTLSGPRARPQQSEHMADTFQNGVTDRRMAALTHNAEFHQISDR
jgi:hypothetical protein